MGSFIPQLIKGINDYPHLKIYFERTSPPIFADPLREPSEADEAVSEAWLVFGWLMPLLSPKVSSTSGAGLVTMTGAGPAVELFKLHSFPSPLLLIVR